MAIVFTLFFDGATEQAVMQLWQRIADAGIEVAGINGHRPHIGLAAYHSDDLEHHRESLQRFAAVHPPLPLRFHHLGIFPEAGVVFLAPRVTHTLLALHSAFLKHFEGPRQAALTYPDHMAENTWTPHCTLVVRIPPADIPRTVSICQQEWVAIEGTAEGIGMLVLPAQKRVDLYQYRFGGE
jgi:hypothetical protein